MKPLDVGSRARSVSLSEKKKTKSSSSLAKVPQSVPATEPPPKRSESSPLTRKKSKERPIPGTNYILHAL